MSEVSERYVRIADGFAARISGVPPQQWGAPSSCSEWTARDVAIHVVNTHRTVLASLKGSKPEIVQPEDDVVLLWPDATVAVRAALDDPLRSAAIVGEPFGDQPFELLVGGLLCTDTLIHTWDLARATGQDEGLDPDGVTNAMEFLTPIDAVIRRPGGFGSKIEPPAGADVQTQLLSFSGRAV